LQNSVGSTDQYKTKQEEKEKETRRMLKTRL
jgi:hypothetical protein